MELKPTKAFTWKSSESLYKYTIIHVSTSATRGERFNVFKQGGFSGLWQLAEAVTLAEAVGSVKKSEEDYFEEPPF